MIWSKYRSRLTAAIIACLVTVSACSASTSPSATAGDVARDDAATITVNPVDFGGQGLILVTFSSAQAGRPVTLQRKFDAGWEDVTTGKEDPTGATTFRTKGGTGAGIYRAVAGEFTRDGQAQPAVSTPEASSDKQWKSALDTEFRGNALEPDTWDFRASGRYDSGGRQCSAPDPSNVAVSDNAVHLTVSLETSRANIAKAQAAGCKKKTVLRNAMISTQGLFTAKSGILAARVKFAQGQGMHGSVWLQSDNGSEIDMIESYGYGRGLTSVIHVDGQRYPAAEEDIYVNTEAVQDRAWWDRYHVYTAEWNIDEVVFRIDGVETSRITQRKADTGYFVVASMLSSDWEQTRLTRPVKGAPGVIPTKPPQSMSVAWVRVWTPAP